MNRIASILVLIFIIASCSSKKDTSLSIYVTPKNPIVIPEGTIKVSGDDVTAPLFQINSIGLKWTDVDTSTDAAVVVITIKSDLSGLGARSGTTVKSTYSCTIAGDSLYAMFSRNLNGSQILVSNGSRATGAVSQTGFVCSGLPLPSPIPDTFSIPTIVKAQAVIVKSSNPTEAIGRTEATATITLN